MKIGKLLLKPQYWPFLLIFFVLSIFCSICEESRQTAPATSVSSNTNISLFANQNHDDLSGLMVQAIKEAKESVRLVVYTLTDRTIISALKDKARQGIPVSVVYDAAASPNVNSRLGNKVRATRCIATGRMHQKILVVDSKSVWIGSANMTIESLHMHGNLVTAIEHPELAQYIIAKADTATRNGLEHVYPYRKFNISGQEVELSFLPDDKAGADRIKKLIASAQKTVRIAMFTWTRQDFAQEAAKAVRRGVDVEVVIDSYQGKGSGAKIVKMLKENGIRVSLSPSGTLLHHKFLYIDKTILVNGSANWTRAAFTQNDDCFLILHDLTPSQQSQMERLWSVISEESSTRQID